MSEPFSRMRPHRAYEVIVEHVVPGYGRVLEVRTFVRPLSGTETDEDFVKKVREIYCIHSIRQIDVRIPPNSPDVVNPYIYGDEEQLALGPVH